MTDYYQALQYYLLIAVVAVPLLVNLIVGLRNYFRHADLRDFLRCFSTVMPWKTCSSKPEDLSKVNIRLQKFSLVKQEAKS